MAVVVDEKDLPVELDPFSSIQAGYCNELAEVESEIIKSQSILIECDKEITNYVIVSIRERLKARKIRCVVLTGVAQNDDGLPQSITSIMVNQLRNAVRGSTLDNTVIIIPYLDLLTTAQSGLTTEAKEVIPLLYENPSVVCVGFKDPSFSIPKVMENLFSRKVLMLGICRDRLKHLITRKESRKFGEKFNPFKLYKYVSGLNPVKLRKILSSIDTEDYPKDPKKAIDYLRQATVTGTVEIPSVSLDNDIGGYTKVKERLRSEILDLLIKRDNLGKEELIKSLEDLIPRGIIFWGPPGTGKTYFAKALASEIGATIKVVSGPELKSKWVGESEENLRQVFYQARKSAPSIIVFDELDSFATARGTYTGSGVEHSMVNQLLTEMDGFHKDELVFIVGTTNFVESLDPALLRPGRFEFHIQIPYPDNEDRKCIFNVFNEKMNLNMSEECLEYAVKKTGEFVVGSASGTRYSGDHINALCRSLARIRMKDGIEGETTPKLVDRALTEWIEKPKLNSKEELILATHEAGHAIVSLMCEHSAPIDKITIESDNNWSFGYVRHADPTHKYIQTVNFYLDHVCIALGAREAEKMLLNDISLGAVQDLHSATSIADELVSVHGLSSEFYGVQFNDIRNGKRKENISEMALSSIDLSIKKIIEDATERARKILKENEASLKTLIDILIKEKTIDRKQLSKIFNKKVLK